MSRPEAVTNAVLVASGFGMAVAVGFGWSPWLGFLAGFVPASLILAALHAIAEGAEPR